MKPIKLYRHRYIPNENILLKDDEIILVNDEVILTKWNVLNKRTDFDHGVSCYFLKENYKISKFIDSNNNLLYWYCDIIDWTYDKEENSYTFNDLLIDIIVYEDGFVKVVDLAEVADALEEGLIDEELAKKSIRTADKLLNIIYLGKFDELKKHILKIN